MTLPLPMAEDQSRTPRMLPADVYDTLEMSAMAYEGIGRSVYWTGLGNAKRPCCVYGHAGWAEPRGSTIIFALSQAGITLMGSDRAMGIGRRISFATWCRRLNVVRGGPAPAGQKHHRLVTR